MESNIRKRSYTIPCSSQFRDEVTALAQCRRVNVADLARSMVLVIPPEIIAAFPDPGEPEKTDREEVILKTGSAKGRPWRRKPRLQVRLAPGLQPSMARRALGMALAMDRGEMGVRVEADLASGINGTSAKPFKERRKDAEAQKILINDTRDELERLRAMVSVLSFQPLPGGIKTRSDALYILGFPPNSTPSGSMLNARFRMLATVHHPDSKYGNHDRMSQLNAAMEHLRRGAR